jgi:dCMP deaminase
VTDSLYNDFKIALNFWSINGRPGWDEYGLLFAIAASARGDCSRRQVGAAIFDVERRLVSTGYNGSFPGGPSCLAGECPRAQSSVAPGSSYDTGPGACHAVHAEANAILFADRARLRDATIYITDAPCDGCKKLLRSTRIKRVVWPGGEYTHVHGE